MFRRTGAACFEPIGGIVAGRTDHDLVWRGDAIEAGRTGGKRAHGRAPCFDRVGCDRVGSAPTIRSAARTEQVSSVGVRRTASSPSAEKKTSRGRMSIAPG